MGGSNLRGASLCQSVYPGATRPDFLIPFHLRKQIHAGTLGESAMSKRHDERLDAAGRCDETTSECPRS